MRLLFPTVPSTLTIPWKPLSSELPCQRRESGHRVVKDGLTEGIATAFGGTEYLHCFGEDPSFTFVSMGCIKASIGTC